MWVDVQFLGDLVYLVPQGVEFVSHEMVPQMPSRFGLTDKVLAEPELILHVLSSVPMLGGSFDSLAFKDWLGSNQLEPLPLWPGSVQSVPVLGRVGCMPFIHLAVGRGE